MPLKFNRESLTWEETPVLSVIYSAIKEYYPKKNKIGDRDLTKDELEEAIQEFEKTHALHDWNDLTPEQKNLWDNNEEIWNEVTEWETDEFNEADSEYSFSFNSIVKDLENYLKENNLKAMVLGVSGGADSTLAAIICSEVEKRCGIPLLGMSLPLKNSEEEKTAADLTGTAFFSQENYWIFPIEGIYEQFQLDLQMFGDGWNSREDKKPGEDAEDTNLRIGKSTRIANGNIMARIRMILLYHLAGTRKGLVIDTDNRTENFLGFFTIHGDQGDYKPFGHLWKTEVYRMLEWCLRNIADTPEKKAAIEKALGINPTDGLGISTSDVDQILGEEFTDQLRKNNPGNYGRDGYYIIDRILKNWIDYETFKDPSWCIKFTNDDLKEQLKDYPDDVKIKVIERYKATEYKRKNE